MANENLHQIFVANPITVNASTDLMYVMQSPYSSGTDAAITFANFALQFPKPLTTKGDIYTYSTLATRLPVGSNGQILQALSSAATGLAWSTATYPVVAGTSGNVLTSDGTNWLSETPSGGSGPWTAGTGTDSAIGGDGTAIASGDYSISYGDSANTSSNANSITLGSANTNAGNGTFVCGVGNTVGSFGSHSFCGGLSNTCSGSASFVLGQGISLATGDNRNFIFGSGGTNGSGTSYMMMVGENNYQHTGSVFNFIFGNGNTAKGDYGIAIGQSVISNNTGSVVWGDSNANPNQDTADNQFRLTFAGGYFLNGGSFQGGSVGTTAPGTFCLGYGSGTTTVNGNNNFAFGNNHTITATNFSSYNFCFGNTNTLGDQAGRCFVFGQTSSVGTSVSYGFVYGNNSTAQASNATAFGFECEAFGTFSWALGNGSVTNNNGSVVWGDHNTNVDTDTAVDQFRLNFANGYFFSGGSVSILTVGSGLKVAEGSNAKQGIATLVGGTVTVTNSSVTANSRIFLTIQSPGGTLGAIYISARSAGTSFTISSTSVVDTSVVAYLINEPA